MNESIDLANLDRKILDLINQRQRLVAELLHRNGESHGLKEALVDAEAIVDCEDAMLSPSAQQSILRHIVSACYQAARPEQVAFLGPVDSYSHLAGLAYFGDGMQLTPVSSIGAVFDAVERGDCQYGIVPIENSTDGRIVDTLGKLADGEVNITGELLLAIHHNLLSHSARDKITQVHSKPQALSQCRGWLAAHMPGVELVETASTAAAAEAASTTPGIAAVASLAAGTRYGLEVVQASIEDNRNNVTRFAVLGSGQPDATGDDKTTLLFEVEHRPGALADVMGIFRDCELNLTWIESFPQPGRPNEYFFIVEFPGHQLDPPVASMLTTLGQQTQRVAVLGSYPVGRKV
ncbi:prephenate dehydratase [Rhodopirellula sp. SWK7]|uniref:prephenate dehydratase n=1 Tax=Rhodopirellula sp. SWK7 TaxID=595460 RepID=UPI0002BD4E88|nr:prephenate dehydratase [Rhodopirellula sp. SWK7]EMI46362.1 Bifunctional P-protein, chorismate mutase/prephenate dehydratase [Rhodopirellula sp. SWK7]